MSLIKKLLALIISLFVISSVEPKKLLVICDMYENRIGGCEEVVNQVMKRSRERGHKVELLGLSSVRTFKVPLMRGTVSPYPGDPGIEAAIAKKIRRFKPDHILIVLHGLMSEKAGSYCASHKIPFIAFYPCRAPECAKAMTGIPMWCTRLVVNSFLRKASKVLVPSYSMRDELTKEGFNNIVAWPHGIDATKFTLPTEQEKADAIKECGLQDLPHPFYLYVGRISPEKNMPAFFDADVPGTKICVGPAEGHFDLEALKKSYPHIIFAGPQRGENLLNYYKAADIFLFPSKMDSFGLVMLEALASGLPVVGFDTNGPRDVVPKEHCDVSYLASVDSDKELKSCAEKAWEDLQHDTTIPARCHEYAKKFSWENAMNLFDDSLVTINWRKIRNLNATKILKFVTTPGLLNPLLRDL